MQASLLLRGLRFGVSCIDTCASTSVAAAAGEKKTRSILKRRSKKVRCLAFRYVGGGVEGLPPSTAMILLPSA